MASKPLKLGSPNFTNSTDEAMKEHTLLYLQEFLQHLNFPAIHTWPIIITISMTGILIAPKCDREIKADIWTSFPHT